MGTKCEDNHCKPGEIQLEQRKVKGSKGEVMAMGKGKIKESQGFSCICLSIHGVIYIHT